MKDTIIHRSWEVGGTWLTNAGNSERSKYEEALRRYKGPARIVLCDEAYSLRIAGPSEEDELPPVRVPNFFSVHVLNMDEVEKIQGSPFLGPFWALVGPLQMPTRIEETT